MTQFGEQIDWGEGLCCCRDAQGRIYLAGTLDFGSFDPSVGFTPASDFRWYVARLTQELELDTSYGTDGFVTLSWGNNDAELTSVLVDADGRIVAGGIDYNVAPSRSIRVARFLEDGSLDPSFGTAGIVTLTTSTATYFQLGFIAFQSTGKIIVLTSQFRDGSHRENKLWRLTASGAIDPTWGINSVNTYMYNGNDNDSPGWALLVASDDKVYVGGQAAASPAGGSHTLGFIAGFTADGLTNQAWGSDTGLGQWAAVFDGPQQELCQFTALIEEPVTHKIIAVGAANTDAGHVGILATRWNTDGSLDTSYGASSGYTLHNFGLLAQDSCDWAALNQAGQIMVAGQTASVGSNYFTPITKFLICSFNADGTVRTDYGTGGAVSPVIAGDDLACSVIYGAGSYNVIKEDDSLVLAGHVNSDRPGWPGSGVTSLACLVQLRPDGSVDTSVGDFA